MNGQIIENPDTKIRVFCITKAVAYGLRYDISPAGMIEIAEAFENYIRGNLK